MTSSDQIRQELLDCFARSVGTSEASELADELLRRPDGIRQGWALLSLLAELENLSGKIAQIARASIPELHRRGAFEAIVPWLDVGTALAGSSGATALKFFQESPVLLELIEARADRRALLAAALDVAEEDANVALELVRRGPELLSFLPAAELGSWGTIGVEIARLDYVLAIELLRQSPVVAKVIPPDQVRAWVGFGMKLVTQNSLGKTDYFGTLEFFRTSPSILDDIEGMAVRKRVVDLGSLLADRDPARAMAFLSEAPSLLRRIAGESWRIRTLQYGALLAERDPAAALSFMRRGADILTLLGDSPEAQAQSEKWFAAGMEVLEYSIEGGQAYFALETRQALASVETAMSGVPLRQIARSLTLFAEGLCGVPISIEALPVSMEGQVRPKVSDYGKRIALPAILRCYPTREENAQLYTAMIAHEAGHLEFGTYRIGLEELEDLLDEVTRRYGRPKKSVPTLAALFALYPQPGLIRDLWTILEDARVAYRLRREYPGLVQDLKGLAQEARGPRSLTHGMTAKEMVVEALLVLSTAEAKTAIPDAIRDIVDQVWTLAQTVLTPVAEAADSVRLADRIYARLDELIGAGKGPGDGHEAESESAGEMGPEAAETTSELYRPVAEWSDRAVMNPEWVRASNRERNGEAPATLGVRTIAEASEPSVSSAEPFATPAVERGQTSLGHALPGVARVFGVEPMSMRQGQGPAVFLYDEWDGLIGDYRSSWCRVVERLAEEGMAGKDPSSGGPSGRLLRRYFEGLRPLGLRRIFGQLDGEDVDLDANIRRAIEVAAGAEASDRVYVRRDKRERDVAVAILVDLSGSTTRRLEAEGRRVIDIEKESLLLLCEALDGIGDQYAIYGYSGQGRSRTDFLVIKEFDARGQAALRIAALEPLQQNRDGAAIRHAAHKLASRQARTRLLMLISDGRPLDDGYADEYALEDTRMALREARRRGIHPFCITVDREASDYLHRMYDETQSVIIDQAALLPERLPRLYRRLTT